jgi:hypothetical protein
MVLFFLVPEKLDKNWTLCLQLTRFEEAPPDLPQPACRQAGVRRCFVVWVLAVHSFLQISGIGCGWVILYCYGGIGAIGAENAIFAKQFFIRLLWAAFCSRFYFSLSR